MEPELQRRIAANEAVFREINERIEQGSWPGESDRAIAFRCECARLGCNQMLELPPEEYERIRAHPRRFLIVPGHEMPTSETVVAKTPLYVVIEKKGQAGELAEASDPRA